MPDIVMQKQGENTWIRYILQRIKQNKNFLCFISGSTGSGKSWSSLRIAEEADPQFSIERVVFDGIELMKLINSGKLKSGSCVVFEEAGIGLSNKNWQSTINKMLNFLIQTFRHRNFVLIMNSPYLDFVDASTRKLFHSELKTVSIDFKRKQTVLRPQLIQYNSRTQKFYFKYLRVIQKEGGAAIVRTWRVDKPSPELLKAYEIKKRQFTDGLNRIILSELQEASKKKKQEKQKCMKCSYRWIPRSPEPLYCPRCRRNPY